MGNLTQHLQDNSNIFLNDISKHHFVLIVSEWNKEITHKLYEGCFETLLSKGASKTNVKKVTVPGCFELPLAALYYAEKKNVDAVICLGCLIKGETIHFEIIAQATANGIMKVGLDTKKPIIFGVLTTQNLLQAIERSGGIHGNKGVEAAFAAIKMLAIQKP